MTNDISIYLSQKAEAQLAYELQAAKIQQKIRNEEIQIQVCDHRLYSLQTGFFIVVFVLFYRW